MNAATHEEILGRFEKLGLAAKRKTSDGHEVDVLSIPFVLAAPELRVGGLKDQPARGVVEGAENRLAELLALAAAAGVDAATDPTFEERLLTFTASDETRDRYGDVILVDGKLGAKRYGKGWQLKEYKKNPVFMPFHSYDTIPLGMAVDTWTETEPRKRLRQTVLMDNGEANPAAPQVLAAYRKRILRTVSVGFMPTHDRIYIPDNEEERTAWNLGPYGYLFAEQELWENSAVSIPANPNARLEGMSGAEVARMMRFSDELKDTSPELSYQLRSGLFRGAGLVEVKTGESTETQGTEDPAPDAPADPPLTPPAPAGDDLPNTPPAEPDPELMSALSALQRMVEELKVAVGAMQRDMAAMRSVVVEKAVPGAPASEPEEPDPLGPLFDGFQKLERAATGAAPRKD